jgi:hypothetical protein
MHQSNKFTVMMSLTFPTLLFAGAAATADRDVETIVFVRHAEKPEKGLGQINCQGLNRALALPSVISTTFGKPDAVFAPDPAYRKQDAGELYDYVRPLATVEPTAVMFGLPVQASIGVWDSDGLRAALDQPQYRNALVLVAWEHKVIETAARALLTSYGNDAAIVPEWRGDDFDSIYVVTITRTGARAEASFTLKHQNLDGQSEACPTAPPPRNSQR